MKASPYNYGKFAVRCFHKAFRLGGGLGENVFLLTLLIKYHTENKLPLNVVFLDIRKSFDLVSCDSIIIGAHRMGISTPFLRYLNEFYLQGTTSIKVNGELS